MNVISFLTGIFRGQNLDGQLDQVRAAARQDAELVVGTYVQEFEATAARVLLASQQRLTDQRDVEDADWEMDYSGWSRPQLMSEVKTRGLEVARSDTKQDLIAKLTA